MVLIFTKTARKSLQIYKMYYYKTFFFWFLYDVPVLMLLHSVYFMCGYSVHDRFDTSV